MRHAIIENLPANPREIYDYAKSKCYHSWVDEKSTEKNPGVSTRCASDLTYEDAFDIIQRNKPHWVISLRNISYLSTSEKDYWEFGGCNIASNNYGEVFIWIQVDVDVAHEIFEKFGLVINEY
jgi:hypothetical protein